jgi:site-specific DNA-methyltransferase (adenine-specific)
MIFLIGQFLKQTRGSRIRGDDMTWNGLELPDNPYYSDDAVIIYYGDCREILPTLPDNSVDLVLTDPPYGVGKAKWDNQIIPPSEWLPLCQSISKAVLVTIGNGNQWDYPQADWVAAWFRPGSIQRVRKGMGFSHWEPILIYGENKLSFDAKYFNANQEHINGHPTPKPSELFGWLISDYRPNLCLDPFLGSGTTAYCAKKLNRKCIGIEIEEKYCEIAANRCRQSVMDFSAPTPGDKNK